ncbi:MAG TPA: alpha-1,4-glucan--maltose-1-phosphate maltosyltransferase [Rhodopila sp.]|uniref:alpha-1,4-glucan--maltose-1-phosphate maltosyltransferase n=1 Tax=Rhodopila sp. TaxID=2480087 RepID=UPI002C2D1A37|nr:alpha-1,4-glucan--maltose-1-phosphate maltosyltransferase [Rhodopila sp.]HVY18219.1 alpha-1,4-glucan--maltose-1-phosphate maltosyltransferase [Rhodopila sp.]
MNICRVQPDVGWASWEWDQVLRQVRDLGFSHVCVGAGAAVAEVAEAAGRANVSVLVDFSPEVRPTGRDPRRMAVRGRSGAAWDVQLSALAASGAQGFRCLDLAAGSAAFWQGVREALPDSTLLAWTPRLPPSAAGAFAPVGFDFACISDEAPRGRAAWFLELAALAGMGEVLVMPRALMSSRFAAAVGAGLFVTLAAERNGDGIVLGQGLAHPIREATALGRMLPSPGFTRMVGSPDDRLLTLLRSDRRIIREADEIVLVAANTDEAPRRLDLSTIADASLVIEDDDPVVQPGDVRVVRCRQAKAPVVRRAPVAQFDGVPSPRIVIEAVQPAAANRTCAVKAIVGRPVEVTADIFAEGHGRIAADLLWRAEDEASWQREPMALIENDRWVARFRPDRVGLFQFAIEAWPDSWASFAHGVEAKHEAGLDVSLELVEGRLAIEEADRDTNGRLEAWRSPALPDLLSHDLSQVIRSHGRRPFAVRTHVTLVRVERVRAEFGSWYELFPRSITQDPNRSGTFRSVIEQLPAIRDMGFDVLYFPPIHPIGRVNRKGRNNSLTAEPGDLGSPYAIGGEEGGHDAIHPDLGTIDEFDDLVAAARHNGLEIALDFAAQCAPDHPWVRQRVEWFQKRPDGSIRYAENPPKKYQDIVNPEFYGEAAFPAVWQAIRDVFLFWIEHGVRIFRVDNPHTKPIPFWKWLIESLQGPYPETIFLAEAFTRPKVMYSLAEVGFSQSYTYFTWRNTKDELTAFMQELVAKEMAYRPNFFVNTPDINPYYLQQNGRQGFLVRAFLATTLAGSWGMYSGFEICESAPLPGREEYLDSEKYEIRPRDFTQDGNIVAEITRLNRLRRLYPALQAYNGLAFFETSHPDVLAYGKRDPSGAGMVLMAVNLRPGASAAVRLRLPLWPLMPGDVQTVTAHDLWTGARTTWSGMSEAMDFEPGRAPFRIWQVSA